MDETPPDISLIIPTLNEAENIPPLVERIGPVMAGRSYEILIVDDMSRDATPQVCEALSKTYPLRLILREHLKDGLGGAVLHGIRHARGKFLVVMDADLQHPPEKLSELLAPLEAGDADFTLGSRHVAGGGVSEHWGMFRKLNSWIATSLARPFCGPTRDPMSGFFALSRQTFEQGQDLTPLGYKIGLELMCKTRARRIIEVPIQFGQRTRGRSKLSLREQFRYLEHLSRLYDFSFPRLSPVVKFLIVTALGWLVGIGVFEFVVETRTPRWLVPAVAYLGVALVTAVFHRRYIKAQREFLVSRWPWLEFLVIVVGEVLACEIVGAYLVYRVRDIKPFELLFICFIAATFVRYVMRKEFMHDIRGMRHRDPRRDEFS